MILDDLLVIGSGRDELAWEIRLSLDTFEASQTLLRGRFPLHAAEQD